MSNLAWIMVGSLLMSAVAMVGGITTLLKPATLERLLLPMIALAAGTLLGGAFFHMVPEALATLDPLRGSVWIVGGFTSFLILEQFLHWHHSHRERPGARRPVTYLVLLGDGLHNFIGGIGITSTFLVDPGAGFLAWLAAVAHEVPQELGDFGVLVHGGWSRRRALLGNLLSALTFPIGAVLTYLLAQRFSLAGLALFGAGNFIYIAASDLVPEIKLRADFRSAGSTLSFFALGLGLMLVLALAFAGREG